MPRLPVDGKKVIEHRITFGTKERELISSWVAVQKTGLVVNSDLMDVLSSPKAVITFIEAIATVLELVGIETPVPTPVDAWEWLEGVKRKVEAEGKDFDLRDYWPFD